MDPLLLFPPEVVHQIWVHLKPRDLLACRAVAPHWLASVTSCDEAWFTEFSYDWHEFFETKKTLRRWSSGKLRRSTFTEVKECVFSEVAFYLLFCVGRLEMYSPCGRLVRVFKKKATHLHKGCNCLMIGVDNKHNSRGHFSHDTLITDFALNEIECLCDVEVTTSSPNGFTFYENGEHFFSIANLKIPCNPNEKLHFLDSGVVSVEDSIVIKIVKHFDAETPNPTFKELRTVTSSPRWIPKINIELGPRNFFGVNIEQRDFTRFIVYFKNTVVHEMEDGSTGFFKEDFFVITNDIFKTCSFIELIRYEHSLQRPYPQRYTAPISFSDSIKNIVTERWSLFKNCLICCDTNHTNKPWYQKFRKNKKYFSIVKFLSYTNVKFHFDDCILCSILSEIPPLSKKLMSYECLPNYAFKTKVPSNCPGNDHVSVSVIYLNL